MWESRLVHPANCKRNLCNESREVLTDVDFVCALRTDQIFLQVSQLIKGAPNGWLVKCMRIHKIVYVQEVQVVEICL